MSSKSGELLSISVSSFSRILNQNSHSASGRSVEFNESWRLAEWVRRMNEKLSMQERGRRTKCLRSSFILRSFNFCSNLQMPWSPGPGRSLRVASSRTISLIAFGPKQLLLPARTHRTVNPPCATSASCVLVIQTFWAYFNWFPMLAIG